MRFLPLFVSSFFVATVNGRARLFDFGKRAGDQLLESSLSAVTLEHPVVYMERNEDQIFISNKGIVTFQELDTEEYFPLDKLNRSAIAVLYSSVSEGKTYYRSTTTDRLLLTRLTDSIHHEFADTNHFNALQATVVTWEGQQGKERQGQNTFQLVLTTDGIQSYAFLLYAKIAWVKSKGHFAQSGFTHFDGRFQRTINSGTEEIKELADMTNMGQDGSYLFRISGVSIEDPRYGDDYAEYEDEESSEQSKAHNCPPNPYPSGECPSDCQQLTDDQGCTLCVCSSPDAERRRRPPVESVVPPVEQHHRREEIHPVRAPVEQPLYSAPLPSSSLCSGSICHAEASCNGQCCECRNNHFGNGVECLKREDPQRITGGFEGLVNGQEVEKTELHTFITTGDGKVYTAVSKVPDTLGSSFLLLTPIGSLMGWLFAEAPEGAKNGFDITGGLFNRTANVHYDDHYAVTINQQFAGRDIYHYFKSTTSIHGHIPVLANDARVSFDNYEAKFTREEPGFIRSLATVHATVSERGTDRRMKMVVDEQIHYKECAQLAASLPSSIRIRYENIHVKYDKEDGVVRFASQSVVDTIPRRPGQTFDTTMRRQHGETQYQPPAGAPVPAPTHAANTDPCAEGAHLCTLPNMFCRAAEQKYRCECERGYTAKAEKSSPMGWICAEDEVTSPPPLPDSALPAGHCIRHDQCHQWGECVWAAQGQTVGVCRCRGWYVGDGVTHCGPPEEMPSHHQSVANPETAGEEDEGRRRALLGHQPSHGGVRPCGSYICSEHAECMPSPDGGSECVCRSGFAGNGIYCESLSGDEEGEDTAPQLATLSKVCRVHEDCHEHASCAYSVVSGIWKCECTPPYKGDGISCAAFDQELTPVHGGHGVTARPGCDVTNDCSEHADCVFERTPEGQDQFKCVCRSSFYGDGWRCTQIDLGGANLPLPPVRNPGCDTLRNCHAEAQCVFDSHNDRYACECRPGYAGDGLNCVKTAENPTKENWDEEEEEHRPSCVDASDCHGNGHCVIDDATGGYVCECLPGFKGDGKDMCTFADQCNPTDTHTCTQNAECVYGERERAYVCKCVQGFTGDGISCLPHAPVSTCRENPRLCHANANCVQDRERNTYVCICKPGAVGDGYNQCTPVERPRCGNCSVHAHCANNEQTGAWSCKCNNGYQGNGHVCAPFTTCLEDRSLCHKNAECVPGEGGHYVCNCLYGYHGNGRSCAPDSDRADNELLIARGMAIYHRGVQADVPGKQLVIVPHQIAVGIDFDCADERIVWSDITGHVIRSSSLNGTETKAHYADILESPEGVAVDWSSRNVYYADSSRDEIGVVSLDGKYQKSLLNEGLFNPRALAIDVQNKHLYYTDWHRVHPVIGRMDLNGKNVIQFVNNDIHLPNGLVLLHQRRELCWVDAGAHTLSCINLDGTGRRTVFTDLQYPFGLTAINEQRLYWTDWKDNRVHSVSVYGEAYESFPISIGGSGKVYGILNVPKHCQGAPTSCSVNNGGCKYLCLPSAEGAHCACPDNKKGLKDC
ncbi:nid-1 [Pristionchus pacificus]|nr:nid-1 [Pristionchus pacificus]